MSIDNPKRPFSKRLGFAKPKDISVWEDAPEALRHFALDQLYTANYGPTKIRDLLCAMLHVRPWAPPEKARREAESLIYECEWFKVYDFMEAIYADLKRAPVSDYQDRDEDKAQDFHNSLNAFFVDEGIGWQMIEGGIVTRGTEVFESNMHAAVQTLDAAGRTTARDEIHEALSDLSRRPDGDLTGAIQHAMAALECVARDVCGDQRATLGEVIRRYPGKIPKPLDQAVEKAWGFASDRARHMREGPKPDRKEVELIVGLAATVATYLSR